MSPDDGYIELTVKHRLWADIPDEDRVTESDCLARWPSYPPDSIPPYDGGEVIPGRYAAHVAERLIERLRAAGAGKTCIVAVRIQEFGTKWVPCGMDTYGHPTCKRHGGPGKPKPAARSGRTTTEARLRSALAKVRAENRIIRQQLAALESIAAVNDDNIRTVFMLDDEAWDELNSRLEARR